MKKLVEIDLTRFIHNLKRNLRRNFKRLAARETNTTVLPSIHINDYNILLNNQYLTSIKYKLLSANHLTIIKLLLQYKLAILQYQ